MNGKSKMHIKQKNCSFSGLLFTFDYLERKNMKDFTIEQYKELTNFIKNNYPYFSFDYKREKTIIKANNYTFEMIIFTPDGDPNSILINHRDVIIEKAFKRKDLSEPIVLISGEGEKYENSPPKNFGSEEDIKKLNTILQL